MHQQAKYEYELLNEKTNLRQRHTYIQVCLLFTLCAMSSLVVYATWTVIYRRNFNYPPKLIDIPEFWINRTIKNSNSYSNHLESSKNNSKLELKFTYSNGQFKQIDNERIYPSKLGNYISSQQISNNVTKLVCYYAAPNSMNNSFALYPRNVDPHLCTHINVGLIDISNCTLVIEDDMKEYFGQMSLLKKENKDLKILLWVGGGADSDGFPEMVETHANRKRFIQSLKETLELYRLDGIDLDWEFPSEFHKEQQHFAQLLHEIRREYQREHRTYLLSVAVAAPQSLVDSSYNVREINNYADYVNIMTYDYHAFTSQTPMTGINAPLYSRHDEGGFFATLNINYTVNYWMSQGLDKNKIVIGLPTYGHSFKLVNPFNTRLGAPAEGYGDVGEMGFVSYSDVCWFKNNNIGITTVYDVETCSPYLFAGTDWISYDNEKSLECKTNFIMANGFGGVMIFSLNTDDFGSQCESSRRIDSPKSSARFPLSRKVKSIIFKSDENRKSVKSNGEST